MKATSVMTWRVWLWRYEKTIQSAKARQQAQAWKIRRTQNATQKESANEWNIHRYFEFNIIVKLDTKPTISKYTTKSDMNDDEKSNFVTGFIK